MKIYNTKNIKNKEIVNMKLEEFIRYLQLCFTYFIRKTTTIHLSSTDIIKLIDEDLFN